MEVNCSDITVEEECILSENSECLWERDNMKMKSFCVNLDLEEMLENIPIILYFCISFWIITLIIDVYLIGKNIKKIVQIYRKKKLQFILRSIIMVVYSLLKIILYVVVPYISLKKVDRYKQNIKKINLIKQKYLTEAAENQGIITDNMSEMAVALRVKTSDLIEKTEAIKVRMAGGCVLLLFGILISMVFTLFLLDVKINQVEVRQVESENP